MSAVQLGEGRLLEWAQRAAQVARKTGFPKLAREINEEEISTYAFAIHYLVQAKLWLFRNHSPRWDRLESGYAKRLRTSSNGQAIPSDWYGSLHPEDRTRLIVDGEQAFAVRDELYASATSSIDISTYYLQPDATGWHTLHELARHRRRNVRVRLLADAIMIQKKRQALGELDALLAAFEDAGIELRLWRSETRPFDSNHRKMILVDDQRALIGGRNFADHYRNGAWRDIDLLLEGPTAALLAPIFERAFQKASSSNPAAPAANVAPWFDYEPSQIDQDSTLLFVLSLIRSARRTLDLELAYFAPPEIVVSELVWAARRKVVVRLLTNSREATDLPYVNYAAYENLRRLHAAGAQVYLRRGAGRTVHSKYVIADRRFASFGSHNLDCYASRFCCETNLHVDDASLAQALTRVFEAGLGDASPVDPTRDLEALLSTEVFLRCFHWAFRDFE